MLTFFATAKAFTGHNGVIQRNALKSWKRLNSDVEVILFGDEEGVVEVCAEYGLRHEPHVERHESGPKYLNYMFGRAQEIARHKYLCYSNCDIVFFKDFWKAFEKVRSFRKEFLLIGRRWDTDVTEPIDFSRQEWSRELRQLARTRGVHQHPNFVDFFAFSRGLYNRVPSLVVGRSYWDHWLVWKAFSRGAAVIDGSEFITAVHQNHGHGYHPQGKMGTHEDALALRNRELAGDGKQLRSIASANYVITEYGNILWGPFGRQLAKPAVRHFFQILKNYTFFIRKPLGLRRQRLETYE